MLALPLALLSAPQLVEARDLGGALRIPAATAIVDFDRDGTLDFLVVDSWFGQVTWSRGLGGGAFAEGVVLGEFLVQLELIFKRRFEHRWHHDRRR